MRVQLTSDAFGNGTLVGAKGKVLYHWGGKFRVQFPRTSTPVTVWRDEISISSVGYSCWLTRWLGTMFIIGVILLFIAFDAVL